MEDETRGFDRSITLFSPDGRLFQVEYARQAVLRGATVIGIKAVDGIVLMSEKVTSNILMETKSLKKIFQIDNHIAIASSGLAGDARVLVDRARVEAQVNHSAFDEPIGVEILATKLCDLIQSCTQVGGMRPFGTSLLIGGVDGDPRLFETDPSGALMEYKATAIGRGKDKALEILMAEYAETMTIPEAVELGIKAYHNIDSTFDRNSIEIGVIDTETKSYRKL